MACPLIAALLRHGRLLAMSLLALGLFGSFARAESFHFLLPDLPPFAYRHGDRNAGIEVDIVAEVMRRARRNDPVQLVPLARAVSSAASGPKILAFLGRTPAREAHYKWLVPLIDEPFLLFARRDSAVDIDHLSAARSLAVGVTRGSIGEQVANQFHFTAQQASRDEQTNARKLMAGRIDAWLGGLNAALRAAELAGVKRSELREGKPLVTYVIWLVASPDLTDDEVKMWRAAFEAVKRDGTVERILKAHRYPR